MRTSFILQDKHSMLNLVNLVREDKLLLKLDLRFDIICMAMDNDFEYSEYVKEIMPMIKSKKLYIDFHIFKIHEHHRTFANELCESLLASLESNTSIQELELEILPRVIMTTNPLELLEGNKSIQKLTICSSWFYYVEPGSTKTNYNFNSTTIKELYIKGGIDGPGEYRTAWILKGILEGCNKLQKLNIYRFRFSQGSPELFSNLNSLVENHKYLKQIEIETCGKLPDFSWDCLGRNRILETFSVKNTVLPDLADARNLNTNTSLRNLCLVNVGIDVNGEFIGKLPEGLETLDVSSNRVGFSHCIPSNAFDKAYLPKLYSLNITSNTFKNIDIVESCLQNTNIKKLNIFFGSRFVSNLGEIDPDVLIQILEKNTSLIECDIDEREYEPEFMIQLQHILKRNASQTVGRRTKGIR